MADFDERAGRRADQLRSDIDHGRTGDKVAFPDPAAAPLGTDDEAAGAAPPPSSPARAMDEERVERRMSNPQRSSAILDGGPAYALSAVIVIGVLLVMFFSITNLR